MTDSGGRRAAADMEVRERAVNDLDSTLCVEAGAGTGKTTILVDRYISLIRTGRASCAQIVAITFTDKAAGEMKLRLREEIEKLILSPRTRQDELSRLKAAKAGLESAPVSTIHSFAASVLREYPIESGVDPDFAQIDEIERGLFLEECWDRFLMRTVSSRDLLIRDWVLAGGAVRKLYDLAVSFYSSRGEKVLSGIFENAGSGGKRPPSAGEADAVLKDLADSVEEYASRLKELVEDHCVDDGDKGAAEAKRFLEDLAHAGRVPGRRPEEFLLSAKMPRKNLGAVKNWDSSGSCARLKEIFRALGDIQAEARRSFVDRIAEGLGEWLGEFAGYVDSRKQRESLMDFDDLLIFTRRLLDDEAALTSLRDRYRYILVDEFQDTDPLQAEIIVLLASEPDGAGGLGLEAGRLFIVGDPKQSIYRFRKADVEIYEKVKRSLPASGAHLNIWQNFRSVPGIVNWVNRVFSGIITPPPDGLYQPEYEPIEAIRDEGEGPSVITIDLESPGTTSGDIRKTEGETVAGYIRMLVQSGRTITDPEGRSAGSRRKVRYGDIAVLFRAMTGIDHYEDPLREAGIPYMVEGGRLYYTRQETRDIASAMWTIEDPFDTLALVAVLRSPIFGFSDEELFLFKRRGGRFDYLDPSIPDGPGYDDFQEAFGLLRRLHMERNERGPAGTMADLLKGTRYIEQSMLRVHGEQRAMNIRKAVRFARSFAGKGRSFRAFARWFRDQWKNEAAEGESPSLDEEEDAVRLITIHKSKGLQFPVVILVNLVQERSRKGNLFVTGGKHLSLKLNAGWETGDYADLKRIDGLKEDAESYRLLYVAMTRARDILVIPKAQKEKSYYSILEKYVENEKDAAPDQAEETGSEKRDKRIDNGSCCVQNILASEIPVIEGVSGADRVSGDTAGKGDRKKPDLKEEWSGRIKSAIARGSDTGVYLTPSGMAGHYVAPAPDPIPGDDRRDDPLAFGSAFHRVMELVDLSGKADPRMLSKAVGASFGLKHSSAALADLVEKTLSSDILRSAREADAILREVPFTFAFGRKGVHSEKAPSRGMTGFVDGRIDLLFRRDGAWTIVDYKTDDISCEMVEERFKDYTVQGSIYALAAGKAGLDLSGGVIFYFARPEESRRLEVTDRLLKEAERMLRNN